jgi:hypothetical protein
MLNLRMLVSPQHLVIKCYFMRRQQPLAIELECDGVLSNCEVKYQAVTLISSARV